MKSISCCGSVLKKKNSKRKAITSVGDESINFTYNTTEYVCPKCQYTFEEKNDFLKQIKLVKKNYFYKLFKKIGLTTIEIEKFTNKIKSIVKKHGSSNRRLFLDDFCWIFL